MSSYLIRGWYFLFGFGGCGVAAAAAVVAAAVVAAAVVVAVAVSEVVAVVAMMELKTNLFEEKKLNEFLRFCKKKIQLMKLFCVAVFSTSSVNNLH